jgi:hypothetical protein
MANRPRKPPKPKVVKGPPEGVLYVNDRPIGIVRNIKFIPVGPVPSPPGSRLKGAPKPKR